MLTDSAAYSQLDLTSEGLMFLIALILPYSREYCVIGTL
jgi:hypothetical protein